MGVAATNALELGIDVGHIDATLHLGFPGSVASLWQQAGRAGRRERPSLAVYVAFGGPLDQYFMRFPEKLFRRPVEGCLVDSHNQQVVELIAGALEQHLGCAALEHPLSLEYDEKYFGSGLERAIKFLEKKGQISSNPSHLSSANIWSYIGHERSPSQAINIRAMEDGKYKVIDKSKGDVIEEIEERKAFFQVYEGAVYMNQGKTYLVKVLDLSSKIAYCLEADLKYFTKTRDYTDIHVVGGDLKYDKQAYTANMPQFQRLKTTAQTHPCKVTTCWFGFYRIKRGSNQIIDSIELSLPKYSYESQAVWIRVPQSVKTAVEIQNFSFRAGLHAASHALLNITPLYIARISCFLPPKVKLGDQVQLIFGELLAAALEIVTTCACSGDSGCPNCIQSLSCHEYNEVLDKSAAIMILEGIIKSSTVDFPHPKSEPAKTPVALLGHLGLEQGSLSVIQALVPVGAVLNWKILMQEAQVQVIKQTGNFSDRRNRLARIVQSKAVRESIEDVYIVSNLRPSRY
ncbi:hypothetical protein ACLOJK_038136 [Asimina triloba]